MTRVPKSLRFRVPSKDDLIDLPDEVVDELGHLLSRIQHGEEGGEPINEDARIAHLFKVVSNGEDGNTYRGVATVEFPEGVCFIDVFNKKSTSRSPRRGRTSIASPTGLAG